jgi:hypothetical protein
MFRNANNSMKYAAAGVAAVVLAVGAYAVGNASSGNSANGTAGAAQPVMGGPLSGRPPRNGQPPAGFGTPVTGAAADKVKAAALAKYPGTIQRIVKLGDGSYVAHVITSNGELRVAVSQQFKVTGAQQGGPGPGRPGGVGPAGAAPPGAGPQPSF